MFSINPIPKCAASPELAVPRKLNVHVSLPPIADVFPNHSFLSTPRETTRETTRECIRESSQESSAKGKRKRVNVLQLAILSRVFSVTSFPSTKLREELARQLGMSPGRCRYGSRTSASRCEATFPRATGCGRAS
ncbi:hypothetical protein DSO57_1029405 [Entomophthora muscae]|uniref:Uncharacterized protein n=1 Tax=Entomophthora muscae TaxID=34485 RepID=A0ACC2T1F6_9FUNG|nr:hypothetical protein DSO57_1029405 [Entomophthora muscae]